MFMLQKKTINKEYKADMGGKIILEQVCQQEV
jgi:hypothetical protein